MAFAAYCNAAEPGRRGGALLPTRNFPANYSTTPVAETKNATPRNKYRITRKFLQAE
jgi:hypothetical protein